MFLNHTAPKLAVVTRNFLLAGGLLAVVCSTGAQGTLLFDNLVPGASARVTFPDGRGVGEGFTAQLYGGPLTSQLSELVPLFPTTTFRTSSDIGRGYVNPVIVRVAGVPPGNDAKIIMRAFDGPTWESSTWRGESDLLIPFVVVVGVFADGILTGLQPFEVQLIPEPSVSALLLLGAALLFRRTWITSIKVAP